MIVSMVARLFGYRCRYDFWRMENGRHAPRWIVRRQVEAPGYAKGSYFEVEAVFLLQALKLARLARRKIGGN